jgi:hypothetical protein
LPDEVLLDDEPRPAVSSPTFGTRLTQLRSLWGNNIWTALDSAGEPLFAGHQQPKQLRVFDHNRFL